jgi:hypothetical protein
MKKIQFLFQILLPTGYSTNSSVLVRMSDGNLYAEACKKIADSYPKCPFSLMGCNTMPEFTD